MRIGVVLAGWLLLLTPAAAPAQSGQPRVLSISIDDPQLFGQGPRDAVVVSPGQKLTGRVTLDRLGGVLDLRVRWRDSYGRIGAETRIAKIDAVEVPFTLPLDHPVATRGWVEVVLQPDNISMIVTEPQPVRAPFVVYNRPAAWDEHHIFVWAHYPAGFGDILRAIGINGHDTYRFNADMVEAVQTNDLFTYVDNIYWPIMGGYLKRGETWRAILRNWGEKPTHGTGHNSLWDREPALAEPGTFDAFVEPMRQAALANRDGRLMFYNMVDEMGLGLMSAPNNFCWSRSSRIAFGQWLRARYGTVAALNAQWGTDFAHFNDALNAHPTFEATFDRLYADVLLKQSFPTVEAMDKAFSAGGAVPSFAAAARVYADTRTSRTVDEAQLVERFVKSRRAEDQRGLDTLNRAWGTAFKSFKGVAEFHEKFDAWTFTLKAGDDFAGWNLSPWCDFREFMDEQVADGLATMRRIGLGFDPAGRFGITGTHSPAATTGHNYELLADRLDVFVPYNCGTAARLLKDLRPGLVVLRPVWPRETPAAYAWHRLLDGDDGTIYWDNDEPGINFIDRKTGQPTALARSLAPVHLAVSRGLGKQMLAGRRDDHGIAIYYSQPSVRVAWWRANLSMARKWTALSTGVAVGREHTSKVRHSWCDLLENLHLGYRFVSGRQVADGLLDPARFKALILPEVTALSDVEAAAVERFARAGGVVIADRLAGVFDAHGKARTEPALAGLWKLPTARLLDVNMEPYAGLWRTGQTEEADAIRGRVAELLRPAVTPALAVIGRDSQKPVIEPTVHVWQLGGSARLVGLVANWSEYGLGKKTFYEDSVRRLALRLPAEQHVWDVRAGKSLGKLSQVAVDMPDDYAAVLVLSDGPLGPIKAGLTRQGRRVRVTLENGSPLVRRVVRVDVFDPAGKELTYYGANVLLSEVNRGRAEHVFELALDDFRDDVGRARKDLLRDFRVVVRDVLTGQTETLPLKLEPLAE